MAGYRWFVAQALAGLEATATYHLKRAGITAYAPVAAKDRAAKLFPGYVFVELAAIDEAGIVNRTRGVHKLLPIHARDPLPLPFGFVDELRGRIAGGAFDENSEDSFLRRFVPQMEVSALGTWPLRDGHGRFLRYSKGCGVVLGYLLGREIEVTIPLHQLSPAPRTVDRSRGAQATLAAA